MQTHFRLRLENTPRFRPILTFNVEARYESNYPSRANVTQKTNLMLVDR